MNITKEEFYNCLERMKCYVPFEQTIGWNEFKANNNVKFVYFVDNKEDPQQACYGRIYEKPLIGRIVDIMGEVRKTETHRRQVTKFFKSIIETSEASMILYNSVSLYNVNHEIGLRCAGFVRPMGFKACPLTQIIEIQKDRNGDRNWKRNLKKAEQNALQFEEVKSPTIKDAAIFSDLFDELKQRKHLGYSVDKEKIYQLLSCASYRLFIVKKESQILCARIIYVHGRQAADVFAANSTESMNYSATHYIMEKIFTLLKEEGVDEFDFSRIPPSDNETNSVYLFKDAAGGYVAQYLGEWIWVKKIITKVLFALYNCWKSKHIY